MKIQIDEVQIVPIKPKEGLVAFASCVFDKKFYLGGIGVHTRPDGSGYRLTYPTKKVNGSNLPIFHPIRKDIGDAITRAIVQKVRTLLDGKLADER